VLGVAYATPWKAPNAYDWCVEVTAYVDADARGRQVGRELYLRLLAVRVRTQPRTDINR
jgi:phosphinothricin acetyltransferase